jgi:D-aminopeptidase
MVMSNFGRREDFILAGRSVGKKINRLIKKKRKNDKKNKKTTSNDLGIAEKEKGSIIIIVATDIPMTSHQIHRISKRSIIGLNRTGSYMGNGSGEVVIGFSTGLKIDHYQEDPFKAIKRFNTNKIDRVFRAVGESTEEAIYN